jgi:hypothetical protein
MNAAFFDVGQSLGYSAVHERLRREGDFSALDSGFQEIAYVQTNLLADILRDDHLVLALDGDECHVVFLNRSSAAAYPASGRLASVHAGESGDHSGLFDRSNAAADPATKSFRQSEFRPPLNPSRATQ